MQEANLIIAAYNFINEKKIRLDHTEHFLGTDIHKEFVEAAKLRCSINQLLSSTHNWEKPMFRFSQLDGLVTNEYYKKATHIVVNPPFNLVTVDDDLNWSKGKVSAAALFIDKIIQNINPGTNIYAILPDVLRSGSRYDKWRKMIWEKCTSGPIKLLGQFDKHTDVDVFAITLKKRESSVTLKKSNKKLKAIQIGQTIFGIKFSICVGPVVDNRDEHLGKRRGYISEPWSPRLVGSNQIQTNKKSQREIISKSFCCN